MVPFSIPASGRTPSVTLEPEGCVNACGIMLEPNASPAHRDGASTATRAAQGGDCLHTLVDRSLSRAEHTGKN